MNYTVSKVTDYLFSQPFSKHRCHGHQVQEVQPQYPTRGSPGASAPSHLCLKDATSLLEFNILPTHYIFQECHFLVLAIYYYF